MIKNLVYRYSPIWLKTILLNIKAKKNVRNRFSKDYYHYLKVYRNLWKAEHSNILKFQKEQLIDLLRECKEHVPYYKSVFEKKNITIKEIKNDPYKILSSLPILEKDIRRSRVENLVNHNPARPVSEVGYTSGTSGSPTLNYLDKESTARAFALWSRFLNYVGIDWFDKSVRLSGRLIVDPNRTKSPFWVFNSVENQLFMSSYHLKKNYIPSYIHKLNDFKPLLIDGYPSAIFVLAKFINTHKCNLLFIPKAITTTAETLYDHQRIEIEKAFNCKVYNQYASSEGSPFITECPEGKLHVNQDSGVFEFLDQKDKPAQPGEIARMVVTSFRNWKTPLIRYDIQDTVLLPKEQKICSCGCKMPYVEKIIGREDDLLWTKEKGYIGRMDTAYKGLKGIMKSQLLQVNEDNLIVNQVVDKDYSEQINKTLIKNLKDRLGSQIKIEINLVKDIPLGANGKFEAVKREFEIND